MSEVRGHRVMVRARRFRWLPRPTVTRTFENDTTCLEAEAMAAAARLYGADALVIHLDHDAEGRPLDFGSAADRYGSLAAGDYV